jgi:hypothetical protein
LLMLLDKRSKKQSATQESDNTYFQKTLKLTK